MKVTYCLRSEQPNYKNLHAVDLSPDDVEKAKKLNPNADIHCMDALDYLDKSKILYDLILSKAVLEHTCKDQVFSLLKKVKAVLKPNGMIILDRALYGLVARTA